jgi:hypothetical protein
MISSVRTFVPNRTIRPKSLPFEPTRLRRFLMALAKFFALPPMWMR